MQTNSLKYSVVRNVNEHCRIKIDVRLNDECHNGHEDFAITGDRQERNPRTGHWEWTGGAMGDEIAVNWPEFQIFEDLHLADFRGIPMYAIGNGMYHLHNEVLPKETFCKCYRVMADEYDELKDAYDAQEYYYILKKRGIVERWQEEATAAIKLLEEWTGNTFVSTATKPWKLEPDGMDEFYTALENGEYTPERKRARREEAERTKYEARYNKLIADFEKEKAQREFNQKVELFLLSFLYDRRYPLDWNDQIIFYSHTNTVAFNWRSYDGLPKETVQKLIAEMTADPECPEGIIFTEATK